MSELRDEKARSRKATRLITVSELVTAFWLALGVVLVAFTRSSLTSRFEQAKESSDLFVLPSPERTVVMSMGYRSALADLIFAHILVSSGIHLQERRRYDAAAGYLRIVNELDPKFASPYRYADTILTVQSVKSRLVDYESARAILERGMRELPYDEDLWLTSGQFLAYIAPPQIAALAGDEVAKQWRVEGAKRLARSCELVGNNEAVPHHCVTAARLFSQTGEREALMQFVERVMAVTDDPTVHEQALATLARAIGEEQKAEMKQRRARLDSIRENDLPFVSKDRYLLIGPKTNGYACFGQRAKTSLDCATSLREYHRRADAIGVNGSVDR
jgi:tetratricopeptide (TPR) repeat protein